MNGITALMSNFAHIDSADESIILMASVSGKATKASWTPISTASVSYKCPIYISTMHA